MKFSKNIHWFFIIILSLFTPKQALYAYVPPINNWTPSDSLSIQNLLDLAWKQKASNANGALLTANKAISLSKSLNFEEGEANGLHTLGIIHWYQYNLPNALNYFLEALEIRLHIDDQIGIGRSYNNIGNIYFEVDDYGTALSYYEQSLHIREHLKDTAGLIFSLSNIGDVYTEQNEIDKAIDFYDRSEYLALISNDASKLSYIKGRLGDFAAKQGASNKAQLHWEESLFLAEKSKDKRQLAISLYKVTELALRTKTVDLVKFKEQAFRALVLAREINNINLQGDAILLLVGIASASGNYEEAFEYKQKHQRLMLPFWSRQERKTINQVKNNFDQRKKNQELIENEAFLSSELDRLWLLILIALLLIILFLVINYKKRYTKQLKLTNAISKQKDSIESKNKELELSKEVLERFTIAASHDLKEPLRNIGAFTDLLKRRNENALTRASTEYIGFILNATHQMHRVLDDLLDFMNLTHPPLKSMKKVNMAAIFTNWVDQNKSILTSKKATINISPLPTIKAYPTLIVNLTNQLLSNAIKFHEPDALIVINVKYFSTGQQHIFSIEDNGLGIDPTYQKKIFETFQRLNKHDFTGTGMGLALCKRIIDHHDGQIWVESKEGKGSSFFFSLNMHQDDIVPK